MQAPADLQRAVLQSASGSIAVPELELALSSGGGDGMVTTVGELIGNVRPSSCLRSAPCSLPLAEKQNSWPTLADGSLTHPFPRSPSCCSPLSQLAEQLGNNPAFVPGGGAATAEGAEGEAAEWASFTASLRAFAALEQPWTLELTDPLDCSMVAARAGVGAGGADAQLSAQPYDRSPEENELFGLAAGGGAAPIA